MRKLRDEFKHDYNTDVQIFILKCMVSDSDLFARCRTIVKEEYFDDQLTPAVRFILAHADEYRTLPPPELVLAKTGRQIQPLSEHEIAQHSEFMLKEIEAFCRYRAMENAILDGIDLLREGEGGEVERRIKDAMTISLMSDLGTEYFREPEERLRRLIDKTSFISTGWQVLDQKLYGGFSRGALNVFCGSSGSGKSLVLQNLALNWVFADHVVIYFTLELSEELVSLRLDSMITGKTTKQVFSRIDETALLLGMNAKKASRLFIKKMPEGSTTTNDLRAFLKEFEIQTGLKPDVIIVDYLDLMYPNNRRVDPSDMFVKDKFVSEELRALMHETNTLGASASQLNRSAIEANGEFDHSHIAGGISKINTADNVIAIWAPKLERGEYEMLFLKTRSSSAVGHRIKLRYDPDCMRITDPPAAEPERPSSYSDIREELKKKTETTIRPAGALASIINGERR